MAEKRKNGPWRVQVKNAGLTKRHGPFDLSFVDGVAQTDNLPAVKHAIECGYQVTDEATGKTVNPIDPRAAFIKENMADLPEAYQSQLGKDPKRFEEDAETIWAQYQADQAKAKGSKK